MPLPALIGAAGLAAGIGTGTGVAAGAAGGAGILGVLGKLATDPVWGSLMASMGTGLVNKFLGLGGAAPYEQANQARLDAAQSMLPELQRAASGLPTAGSDALMRQVRREGTAMQQSMAASARGAGMLGGTPQGGTMFRAQSDRIHAAQTEAMAQRLGQHQDQAQALLLGQLQPGIEAGNMFANQDMQDEMATMGSLGRLGRKYAENPNDDVVNRFISVLQKLGVGEALTPGARSSNVNTPTPGLPSSFSPAFLNQGGLPGAGGGKLPRPTPYGLGG